MAEIYTLKLANGSLEFIEGGDNVPECALEDHFHPDILKNGLSVFCRMGDPDLVHCVVLRRQKAPGGIFVLHDGAGLLFCAIAENNLVFAAACGYFGELTANNRYGVDIYEEMQEPDD